jgi:hypothetical protein
MIAFSDNASVEAAKVGILAGSFVAVVLAVIVLKTVGRTSTVPVLAQHLGITGRSQFAPEKVRKFPNFFLGGRSENR